MWANKDNRATPNTATFELATPAAVTVNGNIDVGSITFTTGGWTLNAGSGVLAFGGTGAMTITTVTGVDTIHASIADGSAFGSGGGVTSLTKAGAGTLVLGGANTYSGGTMVSAGVLLVSNGAGSATGTGNVTMNGGVLGGSGTIAGNVVAGPGSHRIHPGEGGAAGGAATLTVGGLSTSLATTLDFNLVTPGIAGGSDLIKVTGANGLTVNGGTVAFTNHATGAGSLGYYKILQYSGAIGGGGIGTLVLPGEANNVAYVLDTAHDPGFVDVHRGLLGDANDDGAVDFADFALLSNDFGVAGAGWGGGDFNGDGVTNGADFAILASGFGGTIGANEVAGMAGGALGVPEPGTLALLGAGVLGALWRKRRSSIDG